MLTKNIVFIDSFIEGENIVYRQRVSVYENGVEFMAQIVNVVVKPGDDLKGHPKPVVALALSLWDKDLLTNYAEKIDKKALALVAAAQDRISAASKATKIPPVKGI